jgi:hypothetical protein
MRDGVRHEVSLTAAAQNSGTPLRFLEKKGKIAAWEKQGLNSRRREPAWRL